MKHLLYSGPMAAIYLISILIGGLVSPVGGVCFLGSATAGYFTVQLFQTFVGVTEPQTGDDGVTVSGLLAH